MNSSSAQLEVTPSVAGLASSLTLATRPTSEMIDTGQGGLGTNGAEARKLIERSTLAAASSLKIPGRECRGTNFDIREIGSDEDDRFADASESEQDVISLTRPTMKARRGKSVKTLQAGAPRSWWT